ncbi:MAG: GntR family transcriptional regulator [Oscillospiraceae bacterium]|nr:GntR family transcriptional regulator [Oscillospiraceae bacterium]
MFRLNLRGGSPIYEQIAESLTALIAEGALKADEKLPSVRETAKECGLNPNTVQKAYSLLEERGLIYPVMSKGSFVSPSERGVNYAKAKAINEVAEKAAAAKRIGVTKNEIDVALNEVFDSRRSTKGGEPA